MGYLLEVVEDQLKRREALELGSQAGKHHIYDMRHTGRELVEELGRDRVEPVERVGHRVQEDDRIVVCSVEVEPRHRLLALRAPLRGERRFAITRRGGNQDDRCIRTSQTSKKPFSLESIRAQTQRLEFRRSNPRAS